MRTVIQELIDVFGDKLHVVSSGDNNFEVMMGTSSKGNAVAYLAESLNISSEETDAHWRLTLSVFPELTVHFLTVFRATRN